MEEKPYFCPNCRSNRVKFSVISSYSQAVMKDAVSGAVVDTHEPQQMERQEPEIRCGVCGFIGNELRFIRQAEREPRTQTALPASYS